MTEIVFQPGDVVFQTEHKPGWLGVVSRAALRTEWWIWVRVWSPNDMAWKEQRVRRRHCRLMTGREEWK